MKTLYFFVALLFLSITFAGYAQIISYHSKRLNKSLFPIINDCRKSLMKYLFTPFYLFLGVVCTFMTGVTDVAAQSQNRDTLSLHAGVTPLSELLTEEQRNTVKVLNITGTLLDEDYAFLRTELLDRLQTLDLRKAEIDTIPTKAFCTYIEGGAVLNNGLKFVLPEMLEYVGDSAFLGNSKYFYYDDYLKYELVITGNFPTIGKLSLWCVEGPKYHRHNVTIAANNKYCVEITDRNMNFSAIYSADSSMLYFVNNLPWEEFRLPEHTRVVGTRAFEYSTNIAVIIPSGVDSIGDYAFAHLQYAIPIGKPQNKYRPEGGWCSFRLICEAIAPPKLGKEVFGAQDEWYHDYMFFWYNFYVPDESVDIYKNTDVWKEFSEIRPISRIIASDGLSSACLENTILQKTGNGFLLKSDRLIKEVTGYSVSGDQLWGVYPASVDSEIEIPRLETDLLLLKILFVDGSQETFKLVY